jgi:hypothetical protein
VQRARGGAGDDGKLARGHVRSPASARASGPPWSIRPGCP